MISDRYTNYTSVYPSPRRTNQYETGNLPYTISDNFTVPIYKKNDGIIVYLTQAGTTTSEINAVGPFNLESITWEGDYNPKNYRRV